MMILKFFKFLTAGKTVKPKKLNMRPLLILFFILLFKLGIGAQDSTLTVKPRFFEPATKFNPLRFGIVSGGLVSGYTATSIYLASAWYSDYEQSRFHVFNDWYGWRQHDKFGHLFTAYFESKWVGDLYKWSGVPNKKSRWIGFAGGMLFQTTVELMDGFSEAWGWSWGDIAFNTLGSAAYLGQELAWNEQRIVFKLSTHRPKYSTAPIQALNSDETTTLKERAGDLYGNSFAELFFKEYNGQTIWASANIASFLPQKPKWLPAWLNVAVGYGIENVFGAERNKWFNENISVFEAPSDVKRHSQLFVSLDVDFERIPSKSKALKSVFKLLNIFKVPFPTVEFNTLGQTRFRPFYF
jgi:uncharacterized protein YfiM (DUF2279 family)